MTINYRYITLDSDAATNDFKLDVFGQITSAE